MSSQPLEYGDANRAFLQAIISRSSLTFEESRPILAEILTAHSGERVQPSEITEAQLSSFVAAANDAVSPLDLEIRSTLHQTQRERTYALVNMSDDALTQLATSFGPDEIGFLKRLLDAMFDTNNTQRREVMAITSMQALRLCKPSERDRRESLSTQQQQNGATQGSVGQGLTMAQAEKTLRGFVEQGWLEKSRKEFYSLTPRALMELRGWLFETYNDPDESDEDGEGGAGHLKINTCQGCKEILTVGQRCPTRTCRARLHDMCSQNFFRAQRAEKCPLCKTDWTGNDFVGERAAAAATPSSNNRGRRSAAGRRTSESQLARARLDGAHDEIDAERGEDANEEDEGPRDGITGRGDAESDD